MKSGATAGQSGWIHEAGYYGSDEEFLALLVPFLTGGLDAGQPTFAVFSEPKTALLRDALPEPTAIMFLSDEEQYNRPVATIRTFLRILAEQVAGGARQIRVAGELPHLGRGMPWSGWARYEAAVNHAFAGFPLWALCSYDTRITPDDVLADVARTHPLMATAGEKQAVNADFVDPTEFLGSLIRAEPDPLEDFAPAVELAGPALTTARKVVEAVALASGMPSLEVDDLVIAAHEALTNALVHGREPVRLRVWARSSRAVVTVTDGGRGPSDPFAGLLPPQSWDAGLGLWLIHQLCRHVTMSHDENGFTIRLVAGRS